MLAAPIQIAFAHIDESIPTAFLDYAKPLKSAPNTRQIQKWKSRRMAFFLLHQLFEQANLPTDLLKNIQKAKNGRPFIEHSHIDFNISHSGEYVAVILSYAENKIAVGVDIEHPQKQRDFKKLSDYYANQAEIDFLNKHHYLAKHFYLSWCLRESILKTQGVGIIKLSEVLHFPAEKRIETAYCPQGILHFYDQLPFFLSYFFEQNSVSFSPLLYCYCEGNLQKIADFDPLVYHVN